MSEPINPSTQDRLLSAFRALVRAEFPQYSFFGLYEYTVTATDGTALTASTTVDATPADTTTPMPALAKVPLLPGFLGAGITPVVGSKVYIMFLNADPSKAVCVGTDTPPTLSVIGGSGSSTSALAGCVARVGDTVIAGPWGGTVTTGSAKVKSG